MGSSVAKRDLVRTAGVLCSRCWPRAELCSPSDADFECGGDMCAPESLEVSMPVRIGEQSGGPVEPKAVAHEFVHDAQTGFGSCVVERLSHTSESEPSQTVQRRKRLKKKTVSATVETPRKRHVESIQSTSTSRRAGVAALGAQQPRRSSAAGVRRSKPRVFPHKRRTSSAGSCSTFGGGEHNHRASMLVWPTQANDVREFAANENVVELPVGDEVIEDGGRQTFSNREMDVSALVGREDRILANQAPVLSICASFPVGQFAEIDFEKDVQLGASLSECQSFRSVVRPRRRRRAAASAPVGYVRSDASENLETIPDSDCEFTSPSNSLSIGAMRLRHPSFRQVSASCDCGTSKAPSSSRRPEVRSSALSLNTSRSPRRSRGSKLMTRRSSLHMLLRARSKRRSATIGSVRGNFVCCSTRRSSGQRLLEICYLKCHSSDGMELRDICERDQPAVDEAFHRAFCGGRPYRGDVPWDAA
eukprot:TRINITY_DN10266_c0_g1_i1.p1 TRINITY_DN10266_c0_g1~~TRINITY_DN10266_c0_g1_i1.p1  ORF type:complete len:476 (+),score=37.16 TRINITY_DN10266_c0_g1_i1:70-1497(+)